MKYGAMRQASRTVSYTHLDVYKRQMVNSGRNPNPEWANPSELGAGTDWMDELLRTGVMLSLIHISDTA